ncbi:MAG TPA: hypothetical protein VH416_02055 [Gaiellaceae bacterium]
MATILLVGLASGCGGSGQSRSDADADGKHVSAAVLTQLDQRLMLAAPKEQSSNSPTHVRRVSCASDDRILWTCAVTLGDGERQTVHARLDDNGAVEVR